MAYVAMELFSISESSTLIDLGMSCYKYQVTQKLGHVPEAIEN